MSEDTNLQAEQLDAQPELSNPLLRALAAARDRLLERSQRGKNVLFIAEKMAALNVVHDRLVKRKLGPLRAQAKSRNGTR